MRIFNITDITEGRGRPIRVLGRSLGVRGSAPLPVEQYRKLKSKLDRMIGAGFIFVGDALPPALAARRALLRKKPQAPVVETPTAPAPQPTKLEKAMDGVDLDIKSDFLVALGANKVFKKQIIRVVDAMDLGLEGKKDVLARKLIDELSGRKTEGLPLDLMQEILDSAE